jgi:cellulose synthase/poly-beta-1,6-N-acetylglucosamine synthase-like glycosyltransferase
VTTATESPTPKVAVIVPVWNGRHHIADCIESLLKLDYPQEALDLIVVDNRSTDRTREIVERYPVRLLIEDEVQSSYAARNRAARATDADVLAFTDADCVVEHGWVRMLVRALESADVGGVAGGIRAAGTSKPIERYQSDRCIVAERAFAHPVLPFAQTANAAYRRDVFLRLGGFDASIIYGGDLDFSWRMQRELGLALAYEPCALVWHQHRESPGGLFRLYAKNAIGDCLLAERYDHYAAFPRLRTLFYLAREASQSGWRATRARLARGAASDTDYYDAVRYAGAAWGWLRFRAGGVKAPGRIRALQQRTATSAGGA